jgi:hypothetical protein
MSEGTSTRRRTVGADKSPRFDRPLLGAVPPAGQPAAIDRIRFGNLVHQPRAKQKTPFDDEDQE